MDLDLSAADSDPVFRVTCHVGLNGDEYLIAEGLTRAEADERRRSIETANKPSASYLSYYITAPLDSWPKCDACGQSEVRIGRVYACVSDHCALGTSPHDRRLIREASAACQCAASHHLVDATV